jgi:beta-lactamase superfamily II metal-dependent hydrolase
LAKWRGICIPIDYLPFQLLLIVFAAALLFLLFFTRIGKRRMTLLGISALTALCLCLGGIGIRQLTLNGVYYAYAGTNEAMLIQSGKNAILCDLSNGSYTAQKGGLRTVEEAHLTELEGYLLSHYHERHIKSLPRLCGQILIRTLYLPVPQSEEEEAIYRALTAAASKMGMDCALYEPYKDIALGSMTLHPHENGASDSAHPALAISVRHGEELLTYLGSGYHESDRSSTAGSAVKKSTVLIFGLHGPKENGPPNYPHYHESLSTVILPRKDRLSPALTDFLDTRCRLANQNAVVFIAL